ALDLAPALRVEDLAHGVRRHGASLGRAARAAAGAGRIGRVSGAPRASENSSAAQHSVSRSAVGFRSERGPVLIALMLGTALVAMDSTIIATSVSSIASDLGDRAQFPWLFSVYLLAQAV